MNQKMSKSLTSKTRRNKNQKKQTSQAPSRISEQDPKSLNMLPLLARMLVPLSPRLLVDSDAVHLSIHREVGELKKRVTTWHLWRLMLACVACAACRLAETSCMAKGCLVPLLENLAQHLQIHANRGCSGSFYKFVAASLGLHLPCL